MNVPIKYLPKRPGERYASALTNMNLSNKVYKHFGKIDLKKYRGLFKWIDNAFTDVVYSIVPRTTNFLGINFIYESHVLERNRFKYSFD